MTMIGPVDSKAFTLVSCNSNILLQTDLLYYNIGKNVKLVLPQHRDTLNFRNNYCFSSAGSGQG